jgi:hypothetical protein
MAVLLLGAAESSKVPFFILGGALALWAVTLAGIGLRRPDFPGSLRGQRGVITISALMIALAIAAAVLSD